MERCSIIARTLVPQHKLNSPVLRLFSPPSLEHSRPIRTKIVPCDVRAGEAASLQIFPNNIHPQLPHLWAFNLVGMTRHLRISREAILCRQNRIIENFASFSIYEGAVLIEENDKRPSVTTDRLCPVRRHHC